MTRAARAPKPERLYYGDARFDVPPEETAPGPGHNNPPEPTPYEAAEKRIADLYGEASLWLDGAAVDSQEIADGIGNLIDLLRKAGAQAEDARKAEAKPFDDGKKEVQARYKPLAEKVERATATCKQALVPWLRHLQEQQEAQARAAREAADAKAREAAAALQATTAADLAAREAAEKLLADAKAAERDASRAARQTANAGGTVGRAVGLRSVWSAQVTNETEFARFVWARHRDRLSEFLAGLASELVRAGARDLPGVAIQETQVVQ